MKILAPLMVALLVASAGHASAASCRNAKGKFIPCPAAPAAAKTCRDGAGKFVKCGAATAIAPK